MFYFRYKYTVSSFETRSDYSFLSTASQVNSHANGHAIDSAEHAYDSLVRRQQDLNSDIL